MDNAPWVPLTTREVAERLRVSYRQIDHWVRKGYLQIAYDHPGHGVRRLWSEEEYGVASVFAVLIHAGFTPASAAEVTYAAYLGLGESRLSVGATGFIIWAGPLIVAGRFP